MIPHKKVESLNRPTTADGFKIQNVFAQYIAGHCRSSVSASVRLSTSGSSKIDKPYSRTLREAIKHLKGT